MRIYQFIFCLTLLLLLHLGTFNYCKDFITYFKYFNAALMIVRTTNLAYI